MVFKECLGNNSSDSCLYTQLSYVILYNGYIRFHASWSEQSFLDVTMT